MKRHGNGDGGREDEPKAPPGKPRRPGPVKEPPERPGREQPPVEDPRPTPPKRLSP